MDAALLTELEELEREDQRMGAPLGSSRLPGATERDVCRMLEPFGLVPNDELLTWFHWHNGWSDAYCTTPDNMTPFDLQRAAGSYRMMRDIALDVTRGDPPEQAEEVWRSTFLPISGADGDWVVLDTAPNGPELSTRYYFPRHRLMGGRSGPIASVGSAYLDRRPQNRPDFWTPFDGQPGGCWDGEYRLDPLRGFDIIESQDS
jgi:hypothetical protein